MDKWRQEIEELHDVFETYFLGTTDSLDRVEAVLSDDFTIVGPHGVTSSRADTVKALRAGHAHTSSLRITITDARLLVAEADVLVASYVENHELATGTNHRQSTVVFSQAGADGAAPNGLLWRRVHETWLPGRDD